MSTACTILLAVLASTMLTAQVPMPELPRITVDDCYPDTTGYQRITVGPIGRAYQDLQDAIDAAMPGTVIIVDAGNTYTGTFTLPEKPASDRWIIITSSRAAELPPANKVVGPDDAVKMPRIWNVNTSGMPVFKTQPRAHHYRLVGLEITVSAEVTTNYGLVLFGDISSAQSTLDDVPHHLVIDHCYIHGHDQATIMKVGVRLDCAHGAVVDSYITDFHSVGFDAQAIAGVNGPGPFRIIHNILTASGENIMFGGAAPAIPDLVPSDIEIRGNRLYKPFSWRVGHPTYAGSHWTIKNLFELKTGRRVLFDGNILENCWADLPIGQSGYAILLTVRNEGGKAPQADVSDVTISNCSIRNVAAGITISGVDDTPSNRSQRIRIVNNAFRNVDGPLYGDGNNAGPNVGTFLKIGSPSNVIIDHNLIQQTGAITWAYAVSAGFVFTNNEVNCSTSAGGYQGMYGPGKQQGNDAMSYYFPDMTDENQRFHNNALIGGTPARYSNYATISENVFPSSSAGVPGDIGIDTDALDSAIVYRRECFLPASLPSRDDSADASVLRVSPNPAASEITVDAASVVNGTLTITDRTGALLLVKDMEGGKATIATAMLLPGIYAVTLTTHTERRTARFVVIR